MRLIPRFSGTYSNRLAVVSLILFVLFAGVGLIDYWMNQKALFYQRRTQLAHAVHQEYLLLSGQTYALFRQLVDAAIIADSTNQKNARAERQDINDTLDRIRLLIGEEVALVGERETREKEELLLLADIERQLERVLTEFDQTFRLLQSGRPLGAEATLVRTLEETIDRNFRPKLREALDGESRQVAAAEKAATDLLHIQNRIVHVAAGVALIVSILMLAMLRRDLRQRIESLDAAIRSLAGGDLSHRLPEGASDEFASIAAGFNRMAEELQDKRRQLENSHENLETRVRETTAELVAANAALRRHDELRQRFFADISHELRTPVTVIRGEAQFAGRGEDKLPSEYRRVLDRVHEQSLHLGRLVDDLLYVARSNAGVASPQRRPVPMSPLVSYVCEDIGVLASERQVTVRQLESDPAARVLGDEGRLRQLVLILLENGINYSRSGGHVEVTLTRDSDNVRLEVVDNGIGIAPEESLHVMERFYRGSNAAATNDSGSGLGLPVAKAIVMAHDGDISFESSLGEGTRVTVILPQAQLQ